jgi:DNA-binding NarL/FixJ family response regulator
MSILRVFLADDHPPLRFGLRVLLEESSDMRVVGESGDGRDALAQIEMSRPDVAVIDCQLPTLDGVQLAAEIKRRGIGTRVLALSSFADERYVRGMLEADAVGYLLKEEAPERIIEAVRAAARGEGWFSVKIAKLLAAWSRAERPYDLTEREFLILRALVAGKVNKEIAAELRISEKTVEKHLSDLFKKLDVTTRVEAAVKGVREGLV